MRLKKKSQLLPNDVYHKVNYYLKFHCELNDIEHFGCNGKNYTRIECDKTLDKLRKYVPEVLANVKTSTI